MQENHPLKSYNTFGLEAHARYFFAIEDIGQLPQLNTFHAFATNRLILGGGSNILLTKDFEGIVVYNNLKGIELIKEDDTSVYVKVAAGEVWHDFVMYAIDKAWAGIENLSLIPGRIGASPMQNIGAYGVELKDVFYELEAWDIDKEQVVTFDRNECQFGYRESVFKHTLKNQFIILSVTFRLSKSSELNVSYGAIQEVLKSMGVHSPGIKEVSDAVIAIRSSKLPNPIEIGNAGSFFKNPVVPITLVNTLKESFPEMPSYPINNTSAKIPAGWLIEQAGWKGKRFDNFGVHKKQALVLVNYGGAKGQDIKNLAFEIQEDVFAKFKIKLTPEVNFI
ncbi:UDP-N-acetylmuramate dehydrogenase [Chitinophagales bacterium]|nr:UDP-N-acetylmuramate dehydrogenase [Chitinophagales bacterium]